MTSKASSISSPDLPLRCFWMAVRGAVMAALFVVIDALSIFLNALRIMRLALIRHARSRYGKIGRASCRERVLAGV